MRTVTSRISVLRVLYRRSDALSLEMGGAARRDKLGFFLVQAPFGWLGVRGPRSAIAAVKEDVISDARPVSMYSGQTRRFRRSRLQPPG